MIIIRINIMGSELCGGTASTTFGWGITPWWIAVTGPMGFQCQVSLSSLLYPRVWIRWPVTSGRPPSHLNCSHGILNYCHCQAPPSVSSRLLIMDTSILKIVGNLVTLFVSSTLMQCLQNLLQVKFSLHCHHIYTNDIIQKVTSTLPITQIIIQTTLTR